MTIVKAPPTFDWSKARERLFVLEELKPELLGEDSLDEAEIEE
jgi:hypothetical protein